MFWFKRTGKGPTQSGSAETAVNLDDVREVVSPNQCQRGDGETGEESGHSVTISTVVWKLISKSQTASLTKGADRGHLEALDVAKTLRYHSNGVLWLPLERPLWNEHPVSPGKPARLQQSSVTSQQHECASSSPSNATCLQTPRAAWKQHERLALLCVSGLIHVVVVLVDNGTSI
ncbi:hypothetical protein NDU88_003866 [Pleurodeles waltl]|uniref:Uncharacterized protein n=1 Tax=Pleurodeles waltl TaxID=8319 RepID=A0AAV7VH15_PLEWA|nr:hypothetical protein NDU88_003866 [Pleurodeles waltl]